MLEYFCQTNGQPGMAGLVLLLLLEYWLGKTDKTKAGSTIELVINALERMFSWRKQ